MGSDPYRLMILSTGPAGYTAAIYSGRAFLEPVVVEEREAREVAALCHGFDVAYPDERFAAVHASALAAIRRSGAPVAVMDLLIATAATLDDAPVVTRNVKDFSRVPGLRVLRY